MHGISYGSAQSIISDDLVYRKVCTRWVSRLLTEENKANRFAVCERLLARYLAEGNDWLGHIVIEMRHGCIITPWSRSRQAWSGEHLKR